MMPKKYFPNNWKAIRDAPDECFASPDPDNPLTFEDFMDWKLRGWEFAASVACVIKEHDKKTGKVKEHIYSKPKWANKKIKQMLIKGNEFTLIYDNVVEHVPSQYLE